MTRPCMIYRTKTGFRYPLSRDRGRQYKVKSGEMLRVCMTSDFFGGGGPMERRGLAPRISPSPFTSSKNLSLMCSPDFSAPFLHPFLWVDFCGKRIRTNRNPLQMQSFPICPYYAIRAHLCNKFRAVFLAFNIILTSAVVRNKQFFEQMICAYPLICALKIRILSPA